MPLQLLTFSEEIQRQLFAYIEFYTACPGSRTPTDFREIVLTSLTLCLPMYPIHTSVVQIDFFLPLLAMAGPDPLSVEIKQTGTLVRTLYRLSFHDRGSERLIQPQCHWIRRRGTVSTSTQRCYSPLVAPPDLSHFCCSEDLLKSRKF